MRKHKVLFYKDDENAVYKLVKRKSVERKRVLYKAGVTDWTYNISYNWKLIKDGMGAREAEAYIKLLNLKLLKEQ
jgi:hypothetical protein